MSQRRIGTVSLAELKEELSGRDFAILGQVADLRLMATPQIEAVHFPVGEHDNAAAATRACNRVLNRLVEECLLVRLERRIGGIRKGSASFVFALGPVGHRVLADSGARPRLGEPGPTFVLHALAVSQLVVDCILAAREKRFELVICQTEPRCWRRFTDVRGVTTLRPDLFMAFGVGDYEYRFFIEVDRATEALPAVIRKCHLYQSYYVSGREQAVHGVSPRTCWIVPDEARAERLRRAIARDRHLKDLLFVVTTNKQALVTLSGGTQ
jgi:hypothetical protein